MITPYRIGYGFDLHRWENGRRLVLGGVEIPHEQGLLGHSDADALTHAVIDALLGALALGDIGQHFPDTDPRYKDADSMEMLRTIMALVGNKGFQVGNVDSTIVTDAPKMAPHLLKIRRSLAKDLLVTEDDVSVKATRTEGVIFPVTNGLLAMAQVLLIRRSI
ncbi:MAG: 2-C-methyl-D-erythritol 2,4-cyclodiphosphate synthase [Candidatus Omnitrophota bacterium]|jgi:2-C-methyl-D-erythritol 2,4-cyclodiphosphate synthase|nr:MAG: 2-C-methyl-D-erythritol 2,4-cyclodiphosphate synthase [Candidatus Omnitrophota bacterium]